MSWKWWTAGGLGLLLGVPAALLLAADPGPPDLPISDHFNGERFTMPGGQEIGNKGLRAFLRWQTEREPAEWPESVAVTPAVPDPRIDDGRMVVTMVGHATLLVQADGLNILTDPIWSDRAGPFGRLGPRRVTAPGIDFAQLPRIDLVLVSHGHWDHLDLPSLKRLWDRDRPHIFVPLGHGAMLADEGVTATQLDWGGRANVGKATVVMEQVQHWTSRWIVDRNRALWAGYSVLLPGGNLYFAGDTGYGDGSFFRDVGRRGPVRLALLPVGAYEPRWFMAEQHVNPAEAVRAMKDLNAQQAIGMHWGTFQLTDEAREAPRLALAEANDAAGIPQSKFPALSPGESVVLEAVAQPNMSAGS